MKENRSVFAKMLLLDPVRFYDGNFYIMQRVIRHKDEASRMWTESIEYVQMGKPDDIYSRIINTEFMTKYKRAVVNKPILDDALENETIKNLGIDDAFKEDKSRAKRPHNAGIMKLGSKPSAEDFIDVNVTHEASIGGYTLGRHLAGKVSDGYKYWLTRYDHELINAIVLEPGKYIFKDLVEGIEEAHFELKEKSVFQTWGQIHKLLKKETEMKELKDEQELAEALKSDKIVVLKFWAEWCGPCKAYKTPMNELAIENADKTEFFAINVDNFGDAAQKYGIRGIPTVLFLKNSEVKAQLIGNKAKDEVQQTLNGLL